MPEPWTASIGDLADGYVNLRQSPDNGRDGVVRGLPDRGVEPPLGEAGLPALWVRFSAGPRHCGASP
jgi:hypothetical protein